MFLTTAANANGNLYSVYVVKDGESLSQIADRIKGGHTYGSGQNLERLLKFNAFIKDPNHLTAGLEIKIPHWESSLQDVAVVITSVTAPATVAVIEPKPVVETKPVVESKPVVVVEPVAVKPTVSKPSPIVIPATQPDPSRRLPAQVTAVSEPEEDVAHSVEYVGGFRFTNLTASDKSTGNNADLNTERDLTLGVNWKQLWNETISTVFSFSARNLEFMPSTSATKSLTNTSKTLMNLHVGIEQSLDSRTQVSYSLGYTNELFVHGVSSTVVSIDSVTVPSVNLEFNRELVKKGKTALGLKALGSYLGPANTEGYSVEGGYSLGAALSLTRDDRKKFGLTVGAQQRTQNTSLMETSELNIFGTLTYGYDLFSEGSSK